MKKLAGVIGLLVFCALASTGASASQSASSDTAHSRATFTSSLRHYFRARGRDILDIVEVRAGCNVGLSEALRGRWWGLPLLFIPEAAIEATCLAHCAGGAGGGAMWGVGRGTVGSTEEAVMGVPFTNFRTGHIGGPLIVYARFFGPYNDATYDQKMGIECGPVPLFMTLNDDEELGLPLGIDWYPPIRWADVGVGATLSLPAFRVGASPGELLDFLTGWFGLDLAGDDNRSKQVKENAKGE